MTQNREWSSTCSRRFPRRGHLGCHEKLCGPTLELRGRSRARVRFLSGRVGYRWPMEVGMDHVEVGGLWVTYRQAGQGPPLVLLHGGLGDSREWRRQLEGLADDFTVTAWDAPGCGGSSDPPETFRLPDYADCLAGFIQALDLGRPHVGGLSWGGGLAAARGRRRARGAGHARGRTAARAVGARLPPRTVHRLGVGGAGGGGAGDDAGRPPGWDAADAAGLRRGRPA